MEKITLEQLESDFDAIFERVEKGESFHILTPDGRDVMMVPSEDVIKASIEAGVASPIDDDYFKLYQETGEASWQIQSTTIKLTRKPNRLMSVQVKFKKDIGMLTAAANGDCYLDVKNPKLYKKVRRFYEKEGVEFTGDLEEDYEILMDYLASDLNCAVWCVFQKNQLFFLSGFPIVISSVAH